MSGRIRRSRCGKIQSRWAGDRVRRAGAETPVRKGARNGGLRLVWLYLRENREILCGEGSWGLCMLGPSGHCTGASGRP